MPEFLTEYIKNLNEKSSRILNDFENKEINKFYEKIFENFWNNYKIQSYSSDLKVIAIDSSRGSCPTNNGGFFFVCRGLALGKKLREREVYTDFDFSNSKIQSDYIGRVMEWTEHNAAINIIKKGYKGYLLIDGSIYGRMSHIPIQLELVNNKGFMIQYFETFSELLNLCKNNNIILVGLSKESRTSFFREFLIKELLMDKMPEAQLRQRIITEALDIPMNALKLARNTKNKEIILLIQELISRKPDNLLILNNAKVSGYTTPLILGASMRWRRSVKLISKNPKSYIESNFPILSEDTNFIINAQKIISKMLDFPAIISFHILPTNIDTPIRIDIPAWNFGINKKLIDVGWPEIANINIDDILKLISAGYCGLENYNIWLNAVDNEVKLSRKNFEELYLIKFEKIIGKKITSRGYRRVRFP